MGQRLKELRISVDAGQRLDAISPRLSVQGRYSYAFVERVLDDVPNNRSNATVEGGFLITRRLAARGLFLWQRVHGGLRFGGSDSSALPFSGDVHTPERMFEHDRLLRDNNWRLGAGITYSMGRWTCSLPMSNSYGEPTRMPVERSRSGLVGRSNYDGAKPPKLQGRGHPTRRDGDGRLRVQLPSLPLRPRNNPDDDPVDAFWFDAHLGDISGAAVDNVYAAARHSCKCRWLHARFEPRWP